MAYRRWRIARGIVIGVAVGAMVMLTVAINAIIHPDVEGPLHLARMNPWVILAAALVIPPLAYALLLWKRRPCFLWSRGLIVDLWIPSAEAAAAIRAHMKPLVDRARPKHAQQLEEK